MLLILRRLLNYLPTPTGRSDLFIRSSWHKPTPYDQWRSQAPFRAKPVLRTDHFGRGLRRRWLMRGLLRGALIVAGAWILVESIRAVSLF
jgi:hypothetical protein